MMSPLQHRLGLRVRLLCIAAFFGASLLPPYVPSSALSMEETAVPADQFLFVEDGFLMKSSPLNQQGARLAYSESVVHTVQEGDSLEKIAGRYGISVLTIQWSNNLDRGTTIRPGDELLILPVDGVMHTVKKGQTLSRIAQLYDIAAEDIARQNGIEGGFIIAGQQLIVPGGKPIVGGTTVASADKPLQFGDNIPNADVKLKPKVPMQLAGKAPPEVEAAITLGVLQLPCNNCYYTQYYHAGHYGVDIQTKGGGAIFAAEAGTVVRADIGWNGGYGNVVEVDHGNGLITLYAHNRDLYVKAGESVSRGQVIGWMGNTGRVYGQTGIHTHFEVHLNGVKKNPMLYLE
ncbi:peptidoglycan DD-metalloendopeptidase family protein [Candidatus Peregrinibacteria bacterium]|nr:peptidoglycan DD-metalloendopeptidase family protein [Candidatus Peregrinibacteria bacterium]